ncbi:MAG TPA: VOC family protein [Actinomycetota bacterium]|nr:VOC family protein [Actinomycetota bacterium]
MKIVALEHVTVTAPEELEPSVVSWYRDCLGLDEADKPQGARPGGAWFQIGAQQVHVTIDEHNPPQKAHFALVVDDFDEVIERLRNSGSHIEQASEMPGRRRFYTRDPAGNRLEIVVITGGD